MSQENKTQETPQKGIQRTTETRAQSWQPIEEASSDAAFLAHLQRTRPREAAVMQQNGLDRRTFLKLMGASLALTGFTMTGCTTARSLNEPIIPYAIAPEEVIPGRPLYFASAMTLGGYATGLLIETHEGRPTRVEGNPQHPASLGASNAFVQASILELYNPTRSTQARNAGRDTTWADFVSAAQSRLTNNGRGVRILTETVTSPTFADQMEKFLEANPEAKWVQFEPVSRDSVIAGAELAFGEPVNTVYQFDKAQVIVSLDGDFLNNLPGSVRYAHDFMEGRRVRSDSSAMSRLYAIESSPTITGAAADHRLGLKPSQVAFFARALADSLGVEVGNVPSARPWSSAWFETLVDDLRAAGSDALVVAGPEQPAAVHALAHAINAQLGAVGNTLIYTDPLESNPVIQADQLAELVQEMNAGDVQMLFILGGNPVFYAPADLAFGEALGQVGFTAHLSLYFDETSSACQWHIPQTHYIEEWSDARAYDGTISVVQPPIGPLYDTVHSAHEVLAALLRDERSGYEILRDYWEENYTGSEDFAMFWRRTLHNGFMADSALEPVQVSVQGNLAADLPALTTSSNGLELNFRADASVWDGRFAANSWLQELPKPLSKITWDNAALLSPATANRLGVESEDLLELRYRGRNMLVPAWVLPGHPEDTLTISLGYGRGLSADIEAGLSFNAYAIRTNDAPWFGDGLTVNVTGRQYDIATVRGRIDVEDTSAVRAGTLTQFLNNPGFVNDGKKKPDSSLYPDFEYTGYSWGMTIDLTSCIGCNACIIGCQTENNIPTVGKRAVRRAREMHWLRVDRYYAGEGEGHELKTQFQPVPCMHCENAPCEQVCPVAATVHDTEGLNNMVYNRCIGTRYCSANCPYTVRRFNYSQYVDETPILQELRNPDVTVRVEGVMEKCSYCVQRINRVRIQANNEGRSIQDGEVVPACASACPTNAITFGDLNTDGSLVSELKAQPHNYDLLGELNTKPRTSYLAHISNPNPALFSASEEEA